MPYVQVNQHLTKYKAAFVHSYELTATEDEVAEGHPRRYHCYGSLFIPAAVLRVPLPFHMLTNTLKRATSMQREHSAVILS